MPIFRHRQASSAEFPSVIAFLPPTQFGCTRDTALSCWLRWHQRGALTVGIIEGIEGDDPPAIVGAGITLWITDRAVEFLHQSHRDPCSVQLYALKSDAAWVSDKQQIAAGHMQCNLNLWIVHFWPGPDPRNPDFAAFFVQAHASFRDLHDGFGVGRVLQEIPTEHIPLMAAVGMRIARPATSGQPMALATLTRGDARTDPGSLMSFLFLKPPGRLGLNPSEQCMLTLALRQLTDADIAECMGCSRDYIRKLWSRVYDALQTHAGLAVRERHELKRSQRGREQRRLALEFFRTHLEELRPGRTLR